MEGYIGWKCGCTKWETPKYRAKNNKKSVILRAKHPHPQKNAWIMDGSVDVFVKVLTIEKKPRIQGFFWVRDSADSKSTAPSARVVASPWIIRGIWAKVRKSREFRDFLENDENPQNIHGISTEWILREIGEVKR